MLIVDVRDAKDVKAGTFAGAVNIPVGEIEKRIGELPKDKPSVFICPTGARSGEAYDMVKLLDTSLPVYFP
jgi:rhodanese-related sulfurtransferase